MSEHYYHQDGPLPETPEPKQKQNHWKETRVVGSAIPRVDAYERVSGSAVYPSDVNLPGMLYAAVLRCPHAHAKVRSVDLSDAESMPGVHAVIADGSPGTDITWHADREGNQVARLFDPHCRHEGEAVAAVAAETPHQARDAIEAIQVDYEILPFVSDYLKSTEPGAAEVRDGGNQAGEPQIYERGDLAAGFAEADEVIEGTFRTECEIHTPMELHGSVVRWEGNRLTVWDSTQGAYSTQYRISRVLGIPLSSVRVIAHYVGGGFGSKLSPVKATVVAAVLAKATARPVKAFLTREETLLCAGNRPANQMWIKVGAKKDGTLTAIEWEGLGSGGAYSSSGTGILDWQVRDLYKCDNVKTTAENVFIHAGEQRAMRAPGHPQCSWALEQALDELAETLDMDPIALRMANLTDVSQARGGIPYTSTGLERCLTEGAEKFGWKEARAGNQGDGGLVRGVGMASCLWIAGAGGPPSTAIVKFYADGSVNLNMGASDIGTGTKTVMAMVVAEELGVELDRIQIEHADTGTTQYSNASGGSKTVPSDAPAVRAAAIDCKDQLLTMAAKELDVPAVDLELDGAHVASRVDPEKRVEVRSIGDFRRRQIVIGVGYRGQNPEGKAICPFAAQFCEVEVNLRTGEVEILRFLGAHDSGRVMSRLSYDNQVYGGIVMGIGLGMTERRVLDAKQTGKMVNLSWHDYKIPTALDVPAEMESVPIETDDPECNTTGAKGLGEPVTIPTAAAIANAVYNATGVRVKDTPINPTQLLELLEEQKEGRA